MRSKIQQWGNSLALRIPKPFADEVGLSRNTEVEVSVTEGSISIFPVREPQRTLKELLAEVTDENLHAEIETGPPGRNPPACG